MTDLVDGAHAAFTKLAQKLILFSKMLEMFLQVRSSRTYCV